MPAKKEFYRKNQEKLAEKAREREWPRPYCIMGNFDICIFTNILYQKFSKLYCEHSKHQKEQLYIKYSTFFLTFEFWIMLLILIFYSGITWCEVMMIRSWVKLLFQKPL